MGSEHVLAASAPLSFDKSSRACLRCRLVKTYDQFIADGCDNCTQLNLKNDKERVSESTTPSYSGIVSLLNERTSWVGKWLRLEKRVPGCYALDLHGSAAYNIERNKS